VQPATGTGETPVLRSGRSAMSQVFRTSRVVEFADTDMAGIVHFSNFFRFMEAAEHAFLRSLGLNVITTWQGEPVTFPRVSAGCECGTPARFGEVLEIEVRVEQLGRSSVRYGFVFLKDGATIARGHITTVLCRIVEGHGLKSMEIPTEWRRKLQQGGAG